MSRYIDAESLIDHLYEEEFTIVCPIDEVSGVINNEPTADVQPVRSGRWIVKSNGSYCSECNKRAITDFLYDAFWQPKYCPNCGSYNEEEEEKL